MTKQYNRYLVRLTDKFEPANYSAIIDEIRLINEKTNAIPVHFKTEIIISFLKNHSLKNNWIDDNPQLCELVASKNIFEGDIESLFDSCRDNPAFSQGLEDYLKGKLAG